MSLGLIKLKQQPVDPADSIGPDKQNFWSIKMCDILFYYLHCICLNMYFKCSKSCLI